MFLNNHGHDLCGHAYYICTFSKLSHEIQQLSTK